MTDWQRSARIVERFLIGIFLLLALLCLAGGMSRILNGEIMHGLFNLSGVVAYLICAKMVALE